MNFFDIDYICAAPKNISRKQIESGTGERREETFARSFTGAHAPNRLFAAAATYTGSTKK